APRRAPRDEVDLLEAVLADVPDGQRSRPRVEREPPRVSQAVRVDLRPRPRTPDERVRARHRVRPAPRGTRVDPQDLPEQGGEVLSGAVGVALRPAVAEA